MPATEPRTVNLAPTWRKAMAIYIAALEHGTGEGREAARAELMRVADILDQQNANAHQQEPQP